MKKNIILFIAIVFLFIACSKEEGSRGGEGKIILLEDEVRREEPFSKLTSKNDIIYIKGEENPYTGIIINKFPSGNLEFKFGYKNGILHGEAIRYYSNGGLWHMGNYKNGKRIGKQVEYYKNGKLEMEGYYNKGGKQEGIYISYHYNGNINKKFFYKNGEFEGENLMYHIDGSIIDFTVGIIKNLRTSNKAKDVDKEIERGMTHIILDTIYNHEHFHHFTDIQMKVLKKIEIKKKHLL